MNAIEIKGLTKKYGKTVAVDSLDLKVKQGEFFGLLGQNGAGKSTTINCITGIAKFSEGLISVMGFDVQKDYQKSRATVGLSPQEFNADIFAPLEKILDFVGGYFGMSTGKRKERVNKVLDLFELQDHRKKPFGKLSGGLKRRAILARALVHDPDVLILDEPTSGIDVEQRHALWEYLENLHQAGKTIILTSHYLEEVEKLCSRVVIIHDGKKIADLTKAEFTKNGDKLEDVYLRLTAKAVAV
ncbi:ABC transporter ATP-binding protein [Candidatus Uhrbacteria bacterium CG_4_9_14_0_2_um_filter_41_50]|uniref:ABC transporter ATP-binding protein n=1 Tax=Candidatus Uhrbacteria bacterium CG_4_9_14_0_2_um_filter_41_50 TaxID=1975031 RepID=A0A2M8EPR5_9BACT|nr:MAG: ABC transporter ATP-binding protein [Candidatus Uhrbacteria bacterium CG_4_10_14_0_2_um_filter_41_21]PJB84536.1 MAG: ABC transporter ATP-binding protein [Candidatus Uhrbacteria bacterium CG_4_9_14_0_8_um_filter_41_16]PJC24726.1 MAG: ABC transporter ATP-binding protein [Candidatus Uhrbacteria bacterium CG_4_9_14_0_2_um_filter_41_50]PJE74901.1 MAG: ABC transporter ATP-binding protein [Candidatus Uhrbacteria bacterium CG10_big_fil_rev_8_21_14_0_10_41_26]